MRYKGRKIEGVPREVEPIVRPNPEDNIMFVITAITDYSEFDSICPVPVPPTIMTKTGERVGDVEDKGYKDQIARYVKRHTAWSFLHSLRETEGLEWETVKLNDPETWDLWEQELKDSGLIPAEINRIWRAFLRVNSLDDRMLELARNSFLAGQGAK